MHPPLEEILVQNKGRILRICKGYCADQNDQSDLYQEISINIWRNLKSFRGDAELSTWIYRISINTALMFKRKENKLRNVFVQTDPVTEPLTDSGNKEHLEQKNNQTEQLYKAINQLKETDRIIILMVLEGFKYHQIANNLGLTSSNVGVRVNRIKKSLMKLLSGKVTV